MSQENFMRFLSATREDAIMLASYNRRNLSQLLFHAKNDGFDFTAEDMTAVVSKLEANVILNKDHDPFDGTSQLWRHMWGQRHLAYLVKHVVARHTDDELRSLVAKQVQEVL